MKKVVLAVGGLDCASCSLDLEKSLSVLEGVKKAVVNYAAGRAFVDFDERRTSVEKICEAIKNAGYSFAIVRVD